jgi:secreted Zn-dependent insulinase-like peptidase
LTKQKQKNLKESRKLIPQQTYSYTYLTPSKYKKLPWEYHKLGKLVLYQTINNHQEIDISFMVEDIFKTLPDNSALYYKILLNYRGKGSLDDVLRKHGYVAGIKANLRKTHTGFSLFKIRGYATTRGISNLDKVISIIYKYIKFIRVRALDKSLYEYTKKVFDIAFYFNNKKKKITKFLKMFFQVVWKYQDKFWLAQHQIMDEFNEEKIKKFGNYLTLSNSIIMIGNKSFEGLTKKYNEFIEDFNEEEELKKSDPFYKTKYTEKSIRKEFINLIDSADAKSELKGKKMRLFANKKTLPSKISLTKECKGKKKKVKIIFFNQINYNSA